MSLRRSMLAAFILLCVPLWSNAAGKPSIGEKLPLSIVDNRPFVDVMVDGKGPFGFILDTGSSDTTVSTALATRLKLPALKSDSGTGAGEQPLEFQTVRVRALSLGPIHMHDLDTPAMNTDQLRRVIGFGRFDGVIGFGVFEHRVVTLDAAAKQAVIENATTFTPPAGALGVPFSLDENGTPLIQASVNDLPVTLQVDTGDRFALTLFSGFWREHGFDQKIGQTVEAMTGYGGGGPIHAIIGRMTQFSIGNIDIPPPITRLSLQKAGSFTRTDRAGSIGMGVLKRFVVSFDYEHRVMWLLKGPDFASPDTYDRSGMWIGLSEHGALEVIDTVANGPAAKAGIRVGDQIARVGTVTGNPKNLFRIRTLLEAPSQTDIEITTKRDGVVELHTIALQDLISPARTVSASAATRSR
ncbi:PDZ domain-containing protein [Pararobbsia alpina]|uniref:aspartyl protease family protein n=1 Tax=Pararobbsia alpina TaxID=621374 RepID=UPI0039A644FC